MNKKNRSIPVIGDKDAFNADAVQHAERHEILDIGKIDASFPFVDGLRIGEPKDILKLRNAVVMLPAKLAEIGAGCLIVNDWKPVSVHYATSCSPHENGGCAYRSYDWIFKTVPGRLPESWNPIISAWKLL